MDAFTSNPAFQTYATCSAVLVLKMVLTSNYTSYQRMRSKAYANREDARMLAGHFSEQEVPSVAHALRIQRNDLENVLPFLAIALIYVLAGASPLGSAVYCWTFTGARLVHWFAYLCHLQPLRTISYAIGQLCIVGMLVGVCR